MKCRIDCNGNPLGPLPGDIIIGPGDTGLVVSRVGTRFFVWWQHGPTAEFTDEMVYAEPADVKVWGVKQ